MTSKQQRMHDSARAAVARNMRAAAGMLQQSYQGAVWELHYARQRAQDHSMHLKLANILADMTRLHLSMVR